MALLYAREGGEFLVNSSAPGTQIKAKLVALAGGGFVVVWQDPSGLGGDSSGTSIKAQRYDGAGQKVGGEILVNTSTAGDQNLPTVVATANGGFFVAWEDRAAQDGPTPGADLGAIRGQFFDSSGAKTGAELTLNSDPVGLQFRPALTTLADGGYALAWAGPGNGVSSTPLSWRTQVFNADGTPRGFETLVANTTSSPADAPPAIAGLTGGTYVVVYEHNGSLYVRQFDANGNPLAEAHRLTTSPAAESRPAIIALPDGGFVVTFQQDGAPGDIRDVAAGVFDANTQPVGALFKVSQSTQLNQVEPSIAALPGGGYVISWQDLTGGNANSFEIRAQLFDASHQKSGTEFQVNTVTAGHQQRPGLAVLADGRIVVAWESEFVDTDGSPGIRAQILAPSPAPTDIALSAGSVNEAAVENLPVATVSASGAVNSGFTLSYLGDSVGGAFRLEGNQLIMNDSARLDAEIHNTVAVTLRATDANGHSFDEDIVLTVTDSPSERRFSAGPLTTLDARAHPDMAGLSNGGFVLVNNGNNFGDSGGEGLKMALFDSAGNLVRNITPVSGNVSEAQVSSFAGGGFVVIWQNTSPVLGDGSGTGVYAQRFDNDGNTVGGVIAVNTATTANQEFPSVAALAGGGFVAAWQDASGIGGDVSLTGIKAQIFDATGAKVGGEFRVNTATTSSQTQPEVTGLASGGFVVAWVDNSGTGGDASGTGLKGQIYDSAGNKVGGEFLINTTTTGNQFDLDLTAISNGNFLATWQDASGAGGDAEPNAVRAQLFDPAGNKIGAEILVNSSTAGSQVAPSISTIPNAGFVIAWQDLGGGSFNGVTRIQEFDASGARIGEEVRANVTGGPPVVVALGGGKFALSWMTPSTFSTETRLLTLEPQPVTANPDSGAAAENGTATGNVLGNDSHVPGAALQVGAVNGSAAGVGQTITLPSGATLTLQANGDYSYNPNGAFNSLTGATGAANSSATDSFTYTLTNGNIPTTVTITVTGIASPGDRALGTPGNDTITGTPAADLFDLDQGGTDTVSGGAGNDGFYFGATLTSADVVSGGADLDTLILQGNYSGGVTIGSGVTGIEALSFLAGTNSSFGDPGTNLYDYVITTSDANFAAGLQVKVNAAPLLAGEDFTFDGSAETDAKFLIYGGRGVDTLTGGAGHDTFFFADDRLTPGDTVNGGPGYDGLFLRGNYTIDFSAPGYTGLVTGVENVTVTSISDERYARGGGTEFDYNLTFADAQIAAGHTLTVNGSILLANETLVVDAAQNADGNIRIFGGASNDTLKGGGGDDFLSGGLGADILSGGSGGANNAGGNDVFQYKSVAESGGANVDQIFFFANGDRIDLTRIDANSGTAANDAFAFIGSSAFTGTAGELRATSVLDVWTVEGDTNGDGVADFKVVVNVSDAHPITAADFFL